MNLQSDGTGTSGLGTTALPSQNVGVSGDIQTIGQVFRLAQPSAHSPEPVNLGNARVGGVAQQALTISNLAPNDGFSEKLNASIGGATAGVTASGAFTLLPPGAPGNPAATNNTSLVVGLNTANAGAKVGTATITLASDGTGTSGLGTTSLGTQTVNVSGSVFRLATAATIGAVNFGTVHVGDAVNQALTIQNTAAADGFSEKLNANFGGASDARITTSGSVNLLAAGASDTTSMKVGLNTAAAGTVNGTARVNFQSDGTGTSGFAATGIGFQDVGVSGDIQTTGSVFRLAQPSAHSPEPVNLGSVRVGGTAQQALTISNLAPNDGFSEKLNASIAGATAGVTASGAFTLLPPGAPGNPAATNNTSLLVGLDTTTSGVKAGTAIITLASDGTGTSGLGITSLGTQTVNVNGKVYTAAQAQVPTPSVDFGIVHKGDVVALKPVEVRNTAPVTALNDVLLGSFTGVSSPFTAAGTLGNGVAAGASDSTGLKVGLGTGIAGLFNGSATLGLASHNGDLTDLALSPVNLTLTGQVNNFAKLDLSKLSGAGSFSKSGSTFLLDFGTLLQGGGVSTALFGLDNAIPSGEPGDLLDVLFGLNAPNFLLTGFGPHNNIAAGQEITGLSIGFDTGRGLAGFDEFITLMGRGHNASGFSGDLAPITLELRASIQQPGGAVPEPATLALVLTGIVLFGAMHMLRRMRARSE